MSRRLRSMGRDPTHVFKGLSPPSFPDGTGRAVGGGNVNVDPSVLEWTHLRLLDVSQQLSA